MEVLVVAIYLLFICVQCVSCNICTLFMGHFWCHLLCQASCFHSFIVLAILSNFYPFDCSHSAVCLASFYVLPGHTVIACIYGNVVQIMFDALELTIPCNIFMA